MTAAESTPIWCPECHHDIDMHEAHPVSPGCQDAPGDFDELMVPVDGTCTCGLIPSEIARKLLANPRDEYHTMDELYHYRMLYNAVAVNSWRALGLFSVHKSWRHSDGELCFGGGWFTVVAQLPAGQVSNHYAAEHWDLFQVPERERAAEYDGHTPQQAAARLTALAMDRGALWPSP